MQKITLYTEDFKNLSGIVSEYFDSFTIVRSTGFWKTRAEFSVQIILFISDSDIKEFQKAKDLANKIRIVNNQESVLFEHQCGVNVEFITGAKNETKSS